MDPPDVGPGDARPDVPDTGGGSVPDVIGRRFDTSDERELRRAEVDRLQELAEFDRVSEEFKFVNLNGPSEVGLSAGAELTKDMGNTLFVGKGNWSSAASAFSLTEGMIGTLNDVRRMAVAAAILVNENKWYGENTFTTEKYTGPTGPSFRATVSEFIGTITSADFQKAANILAAGKVNFYAMNHHVGTGQLAGYMSKVAVKEFSKPVAIDAKVFKALWMVCHWIETAVIFRKAGLECNGARADAKPFPTMAEDIMLRFKGFPSGAGKFGLCLAIVKRIIAGMYAYVLPAVDGIAYVVKMCKAILDDPLSYHTGAYHLIGRERIMISVDEDLFLYCAAYVHTVAPGSSLAKSPGLPDKTSIGDHNVSTIISNINVQIAKEGLNDAGRMKALTDNGAMKNTIISFVQANSEVAEAFPSLAERVVEVSQLGESADVSGDKAAGSGSNVETRGAGHAGKRRKAGPI